MIVLSKASFVELRADRGNIWLRCSSNECYLGSCQTGRLPIRASGPEAPRATGSVVFAAVFA